MLSCFVDEFNRRLADVILEALMADQGTSAAERRRRGSRRAFEPPPPLFLPAPQLLEGIVQVIGSGDGGGGRGGGGGWGGGG